jgi:hypothetical protein
MTLPVGWARVVATDVLAAKRRADIKQATPMEDVDRAQGFIFPAGDTLLDKIRAEIKRVERPLKGLTECSKPRPQFRRSVCFRLGFADFLG